MPTLGNDRTTSPPCANDNLTWWYGEFNGAVVPVQGQEPLPIEFTTDEAEIPCGHHRVMEVHDFDDRDVCELLTEPTFMVELWSWNLDRTGEPQHHEMRASVLTGCDVQEAMTWCEQNKPTPGCFVLYAGTWTNRGFLSALWLAGHTPTPEDRPHGASSTVTYTI